MDPVKEEMKMEVWSLFNAVNELSEKAESAGVYPEIEAEINDMQQSIADMEAKLELYD